MERYEIECNFFEDEEVEKVFRYITINLMELFYFYRDKTWEIPSDEKIVKMINKSISNDKRANQSNIICTEKMINIIPAGRNLYRRCGPIIVVFCFDEGKLDTRFRELKKHLSLSHKSATTKVLILTDQWNNKIWKGYLDAFEFLKDKNNIKIFKAQLEGDKFVKSRLL